MRLIGNKTRLLGEIAGFLHDKGVRGGTLIDIFCGTASVGRRFKELGFRVIANDQLAMCHTKAVADIEVVAAPSFRGLRDRHARAFRSRAFSDTFAYEPSPVASGDTVALARAVHFLGRCADPCEGLIFRNYAPGGGRGRRYFSDENARRIDGALAILRDGHRHGYLDRAETALLLSSLLDAADRVANISGTYGAYLKSWQRNALKPLELAVPEVIPSAHANEAHRRDANELIASIQGDVLYLDPPYNHRQYAANYHVLEIIAEHHTIDDVAAYEAALYGKTGLRPYDHLRSAYCVAPSTRAAQKSVDEAMRDLVHRADVDHVLVSYSEEGLLSEQELGGILARFAGEKSFDYRNGMRRISHKRFCSDSDRPGTNDKGLRAYKVLEGRKRGETCEWLFYAARRKSRSRGASGRKRRSSVPA